MKDSRWLKVLVVLLVISFVFSIIPVKQDSVVRAATFQKRTQDSVLEPIKYRSVEKHSYKASVRTVSEWSGHANIEISFTNTGKETIHDWYFTFEYIYIIENPNNCSIVEHKDNLYTIANHNWNQDIGPGKTVTVGFTAVSGDGSDIVNSPSFYLLNTKTITLTEKELSIKYEEYSDWGSGFNGALILTNKTNNEIRDWSVTFNSNRPITRVDSASYKNKGDDSYSIINDGNNQNIAKGKKYRVGIEGGNHDTKVPFTLSDITISAKKLAIKLSDDKNKNGIADVRETDYSGTMNVTPTPTVTATPIPTPTTVPTSAPTSTPIPTATSAPIPTSAPTSVPTVTTIPTGMPSVTPTLTPSPDPTGNPTPTVFPTTTPIPTGIPEDIDYDKDSDSDGLPDDIEDYYGTDKNKADTDGDGVNDFCELLLGSDPKTADNIGNLDRDADGLSNAKESELGTNPTVRDTDMDGLSDGEEVKLYGSDPTEYDTDEDGISDYNEVQLGSNPKVQDSSKKRRQTKTLKITDESTLKGVTEVTVSGEISGSMEENTDIKDVYGKDQHTSSIEALVGNPVSITSTGAFDAMTITFKYSEGLNEKNLRIMWYDEANYEYVVLDNATLDKLNKTISVTTNHFSTYMLIDEEVWVKTWVISCASLNSSGGNRYSNIVHPNAGIGYTDYKTADEFLKALKGEYSDGDSDGIVNPVERVGVIDNIGHIIKTNPSSVDSDDDGLNDGQEIGIIKLVGDKISDSKFLEYINLIPVESGRQYGDFVYYVGPSDPTNEDSDEDGAKDYEDETPYLKNGPVNYMLVGKDRDGENSISRLVKPYKDAFKRIGEKVVVLYIYAGSDYQKKVEDFFNVDDAPASILAEYTFSLLQYNLEKEKIAKKAYSYVNRMIIDAHGRPDRIEFEPGIRVELGSIFTNQIERYQIACQINILDIQSCLCGKSYYVGDSIVDTCVAMNFVRRQQIQKVYAWTTETKSTLFKRYSYSIEAGSYMEFYMVGEYVHLRTVKTDTDFIGRPTYAPLQY